MPNKKTPSLIVELPYTSYKPIDYKERQSVKRALTRSVFRIIGEYQQKLSSTLPNFIHFLTDKFNSIQNIDEDSCNNYDAVMKNAQTDCKNEIAKYFSLLYHHIETEIDKFIQRPHPVIHLSYERATIALRILEKEEIIFLVNDLINAVIHSDQDTFDPITTMLNEIFWEEDDAVLPDLSKEVCGELNAELIEYIEKEFNADLREQIDAVKVCNKKTRQEFQLIQNSLSMNQKSKKIDLNNFFAIEGALEGVLSPQMNNMDTNHRKIIAIIHDVNHRIRQGTYYRCEAHTDLLNQLKSEIQTYQATIEVIKEWVRETKIVCTLNVVVETLSPLEPTANEILANPTFYTMTPGRSTP